MSAHSDTPPAGRSASVAHGQGTGGSSSEDEAAYAHGQTTARKKAAPCKETPEYKVHAANMEALRRRRAKMEPDDQTAFDLIWKDSALYNTCTLPCHAGTHSWWVYTHQEMGKKEQAAFAQNNKHLGVAAMRTALESFRHEFRAERTTAHIGKAMIFEQIVKELGGNEAVAKRCPQLRCQWPNPQPVATCSIKIRGSGTAPTSRNIIPTGSSPAAPCMARPPGGTARPCSRIHMGRQSSTAKWSTCPRARPQQAHLKFGICCPRVRVRLCSWGTGARH